MTTIHIDGAIGWDVTARDIREQLSGAGDIDLQISSPGGAVDEGLAIINALRDHRRAGHQITARVVGYAASMATGIALAADRVEVEDNSIWMIHNPLGLEIGDYRAMHKYGDILDSLARVLAKSYTDKTGRDLAAIRQEMDDETWLFGQEIIDAGYADAMTPAGDGPESKADAQAIARSALQSMTAKLREREQTPLDQIAALLPQPTAAKANTTPEPTMPDTTADSAATTASESAVDVAAIQAAAAQAERERIFAIIDCEAAKDREALAVNLARVHAMTAESAASVLAALPKASAPGWSADSGEIRQTTSNVPSGAPAASVWDSAITKVNAKRG